MHYNNWLYTSLVGLAVVDGWINKYLYGHSFSYNYKLIALKCLSVQLNQFSNLVKVHRISFFNVADKIFICILFCLAITLPPHKFIQVFWEMLIYCSMHSLKLYFNSGSIYMLSMSSCDGVNKVKEVIHRWMGISCWRDSIVGCPLIRMHECTTVLSCTYMMAVL